MYVKYNAVSRGFAAAGNNMYPATIHLICSGVRKLSRVTEVPKGLKVYRGNGNMALPRSFTEKDTQGFAGGVECALMSTTPDVEVALGYSGLKSGKELPTLFEIEVGKTSIGANVSVLSQFEGEQVYLYAPLTHMQLLDEPRLEDHDGRQLSILRLQLTVNQKIQTVDEAHRSRKDFLKHLVSTLVSDVRQWIHGQQFPAKNSAKNEAMLKMKDMHGALQKVVDDATPEHLNNNKGFVEVFVDAIDKSEEKRVELVEELWKKGEECLEAESKAGQNKDAKALLEIAMDGRGKSLCADIKAGRDRVITMRRRLKELRGFDDKQQNALDNMRLAKDLHDQGKHTEAMTLYREAAELFKQEFSEDDQGVADAYMGMANAYSSQGQNDAALKWYQKCLDIQIKHYGCDHKDVAATYINIGNVFETQDNFEKALDYLQKGRDVFKDVFGDLHEDVASSLGSIGNVYCGQEQYDRALEFYQEDIKITTKLKGQNAPGLSFSYNNVGYVYDVQGRWDEALENYQKALKIDQEVHGEEHADVATSKYNIANVFEGQEKWEDARRVFEECQEIRVKVLGKDHEDTLDARQRAEDVKKRLQIKTSVHSRGLL